MAILSSRELVLALLAASLVARASIPAVAAGVTAGSAATDGAALYAARCSSCHDHPVDRIPPKVFLSTTRAADEIIDALTSGVMRAQGAGLTEPQIRAVAVYLTGREPSDTRPDPAANMCPSPATSLQLRADDWNGWGRDQGNSRFQPRPGLTAPEVPRLKLKWAFAYPGRVAFGQPTAVGDLVLAGGVAGRLFALDASSGCTHWSYDAGAIVRTGIVVGEMSAGPSSTSDTRTTAWFGDDKGILHAVDLATGARVWSVRLDDHRMSRLIGTPQLAGGVLYVPVSSMEEVAAADPHYPCCTFRGSIVAVDAASGRKLWQSYSVRDPPRSLGASSGGTARSGPAGGAIFSSPAIDVERGRLYAGTGDAYTSVPSDSTDAILAIDLANGGRVWTHQVLKNDAWIMLCNARPHTNCPRPLGPDFDFASAPILVNVGAKQLLVAGAKSGIVYGLDPARNGAPVWVRPLVRGSSHGGILWGAATDGSRVYVATSGYDYEKGTGPGALVALDAATGTLLWRTPTPDSRCAWGTLNCSHALIAGVSAMPGVVFAGGMDGWIRAYDTRNGAVIWQFDTAQSFETANGVPARGGAIDYGGQAIAHGRLFVNSGSMRKAGNVLLAFTVDGR